MSCTCCAICLESITVPVVESGSVQSIPLKVCPRDERVICLDCFNSYVESLLSESFPGTCPSLRCPLCKTQGCIIPSNFFGALKTNLIEKYLHLAKSLLSIQCSGCHQRSSLLVNREEQQIDEITKSFQERFGPGFHDLISNLSRYETGSISIPSFYEILESYFQELVRSDSAASWSTMKKFLQLISNPERRANMQLRYIRIHPFVTTLCCSRVQCFHCRTGDTHPGKSCHQVMESRPFSEMIQCSQCSIYLVKGDGCDSLTCVCGTRFSFSTELTKYNQSSFFQEAFPHDTPNSCVKILCGSLPYDNISLARSWYQLHSSECTGSLLEYWRGTYPYSATQCALVIGSTSSEFLEKSRQLWIQHHQEDYQKSKVNQELSLECIWDSLYPQQIDKREAAVRILSVSPSSVDPMQRHLSAHVRDIVQAKLKSFATQDNELMRLLCDVTRTRTLALQFLLQFGHTSVGLIESKSASNIGIISTDKISSSSSPTQLSSQNSLFGNSFPLEFGDIVSSLLSSHEGSSGSVQRRYEEDNTYDIYWVDLNFLERIHRNCLKFKGKGSILQPIRASCNKEQLVTFKEFLRHTHNLLSRKWYSPSNSSEETKVNQFAYEMTAYEHSLLAKWIQSCQRNGSNIDIETKSLEKICKIIESDGPIGSLRTPHELVPPNYPIQSLRWIDLYSVILANVNR